MILLSLRVRYFHHLRISILPTPTNAPPSIASYVQSLCPTTAPAPATVPNPVPASPATATVHFLLHCLRTAYLLTNESTLPMILFRIFILPTTLNRFYIHSSIGSYYGSFYSTIYIDRGDTIRLPHVVLDLH